MITSVQLATSGIKALPDDHPKLAGYLTNLGRALELRYDIAGQQDAAETAVKLWQRAASVQYASTAVRLSAAQCWAELAQTAKLGEPSALDGYVSAIELMPVVAWRGLQRSQREYALVNYPDLGRNA